VFSKYNGIRQEKTNWILTICPQILDGCSHNSPPSSTVLSSHSQRNTGSARMRSSAGRRGCRSRVILQSYCTHFLGAGTRESGWRMRSIRRGLERLPFLTVVSNNKKNSYGLDGGKKNNDIVGDVKRQREVFLNLRGWVSLSFSPVSTKKRLASGFSAINPLKNGE